MFDDFVDGIEDHSEKHWIRYVEKRYVIEQQAANIMPPVLI